MSDLTGGNLKFRVMQRTETGEEFWAFEGSMDECLTWIEDNQEQFEESTFNIEVTE